MLSQMVRAGRGASWLQRFALSLAVLASVLLALGGGLGDAWLCSMSGARNAPCCCADEAEQAPQPPQAQRPSCCSRAEVASSTVATTTTSQTPNALPVRVATQTDPLRPIALRAVLPSRGRGPPLDRPPAYLVHQALLL